MREDIDLKEQRTHGKKAGNDKNRAEWRAEAENESESRSNGAAGERQEKSRTVKRRV